MSALCDATTSAGKPCKNRSAGTVGGRQYCRVGAHRAQIEALLPTAVEPEEAEVVNDSGPEVVEAAPAAEEVVTEVVTEVVEELPPVDPTADCTFCGHEGPHVYKGGPRPAERGTTLMCRGCLNRWVV